MSIKSLTRAYSRRRDGFDVCCCNWALYFWNRLDGIHSLPFRTERIEITAPGEQGRFSSRYVYIVIFQEMGTDRTDFSELLLIKIPCLGGGCIRMGTPL